MAAPAATTPGQSSQEIIDQFWKSSLGDSSTITKPPSVLPPNIYTQLIGTNTPKGAVTGRPVNESYDLAVKECEAKVAQIVAECRRTNTKYTDPYFNLDDTDYCLNPLGVTPPSPTSSDDGDQTITYDVTQKATSTGGTIAWGNIQPDQPDSAGSSGPSGPSRARRVGWIFEKPKFYVGKEAHVRDIRQGAEGDCWFISSLGSLCVEEEIPKLIERICPASCRDEKVGVYGFVFSRDGEWISEIVDDKLYIKAPDYDDCDDERRAVWDASHYRLDPEVSRKLWRKTFQSNSDALYYASCAHPDETWVPLVEKAFAKAHGDFDAIDGGWPGEGVEDLTGGITTEFISDDILDLDQLWADFLKVNKEFLFGAGTRNYGHPDPDENGRQGIEDGHAYSVLRAVDYAGQRLLMVKNPWGYAEWNGPWSDGSKEWTADAIKTLDYKFGNDGIFWMPFEDFLERFVQVWRTRLFTPDWNVSQHWTTIAVPWSGFSNPTSFSFSLPSASKTVIVLSQLDARYFGGLTGQYSFELAFRVHSAGSSDYIIRGYSSGDRSAVTEVDLEAGEYEVRMQIQGYRDSSQPKIEDVVKQNWLNRRDKLIRVGLSYDLAHAKGWTESMDKKAATAASTSSAPAPTPATAPATTNMNDAAQTVEETAGLGAEPGFDADPAPAPAAAATDSPAKADDPWNAPLVVGLRVFAKGTSAVIKVVSEQEAKKTEGKLDGKKLDVDDPEKQEVVSPVVGGERGVKGDGNYGGAKVSEKVDEKIKEVGEKTREASVGLKEVGMKRFPPGGGAEKEVKSGYYSQTWL